MAHEKTANEFKVQELRIAMDERLAQRKLDLEIEEKTKEREWKSQEQKRELEFKEKQEERNHQRQLEIMKERDRSDERMLKIIELLSQNK